MLVVVLSLLLEGLELTTRTPFDEPLRQSILDERIRRYHASSRGQIVC
jgi:hypothetical protein